MQEFSSRKITQYRFHVDKNEGKSGIGYDMIICRDPMLQLGLLAEFKRRVLKRYGVTVPMKEPRGMLGKSYLTSHKMREVVIQTV